MKTAKPQDEAASTEEWEKISKYKTTVTGLKDEMTEKDKVIDQEANEEPYQGETPQKKTLKMSEEYASPATYESSAVRSEHYTKSVTEENKGPNKETYNYSYRHVKEDYPSQSEKKVTTIRESYDRPRSERATATFKSKQSAGETSYKAETSLKEDVIEAKERVERMLDDLRPYNREENYEKERPLPKSEFEVRNARNEVLEEKEENVNAYSFYERNKAVSKRSEWNEFMSKEEIDDLIMQCRMLRQRIEDLQAKHGFILEKHSMKSFGTPTHDYQPSKYKPMLEEGPYLFYIPSKYEFRPQLKERSYLFYKPEKMYESKSLINETFKTDYESSYSARAEQLQKEKDILIDQCIELREQLKELEQRVNKSNYEEKDVSMCSCMGRLETLEKRVGDLAGTLEGWAGRTNARSFT